MGLQRADRLLEALSSLGAEGMIVHDRSNMRWLSGYSGEGLLFVAKGHCAVVTDFRYTEQAEQEAPGFSVRMTTSAMPHEKVLGELAAEAGMKTLAYEENKVTVKGFKALSSAMPTVSFVSAENSVQKLRQIKDAAEIALIEQACRISSAAFDEMLGVIKPGMTELDVRLELEMRLYRLGAEKTAFDSIIATGANGALPHAVPGKRVIEKGHMVTMDFGARVGGYCSDMTRTVAVGAMDDTQRKVYDTVLAAQKLAFPAIRPGEKCRAVDKIARDFIDAAGYEGCFGHGLGHSLGLDIHESPRLNTISEDTLACGMILTNEPGIYLHGLCGCRIEDTVLVTEDGARILTPSTKELIIL